MNALDTNHVPGIEEEMEHPQGLQEALCSQALIICLLQMWWVLFLPSVPQELELGKLLSEGAAGALLQLSGARG